MNATPHDFFAPAKKSPLSPRLFSLQAMKFRCRHDAIKTREIFFPGLLPPSDFPRAIEADSSRAIKYSATSWYALVFTGSARLRVYVQSRTLCEQWVMYVGTSKTDVVVTARPRPAGRQARRQVGRQEASKPAKGVESFGDELSQRVQRPHGSNADVIKQYSRLNVALTIGAACLSHASLNFLPIQRGKS